MLSRLLEWVWEISHGRVCQKEVRKHPVQKSGAKQHFLVSKRHSEPTFRGVSIFLASPAHSTARFGCFPGSWSGFGGFPTVGFANRAQRVLVQKTGPKTSVFCPKTEVWGDFGVPLIFLARPTHSSPQNNRSPGFWVISGETPR